MNSGPLSTRRYFGAAFVATRSSQCASTPFASMDRDAEIQRLSLEYSSIVFNTLMGRVSVVWSNWKSIAQHTFTDVG